VRVGLEVERDENRGYDLFAKLVSFPSLAKSGYSVRHSHARTDKNLCGGKRVKFSSRVKRIDDDAHQATP
jgi:hypothetical protein